MYLDSSGGGLSICSVRPIASASMLTSSHSSICELLYQRSTQSLWVYIVYNNAVAMGNQKITAMIAQMVNVEHPDMTPCSLVLFGQEFSLKVTRNVDEAEYKLWKGQMQQQKASQYTLLPLGQTFSKAEFCGNRGSAELFYPNFPHPLSSEIASRRHKSLRFTEQELWYILYAILRAKKQSPNGLLGDIRPLNVLLNAEEKVKVVSLLSGPQFSSKYQHAADDTVTYLAPEELPLFENGQLEVQNNTQQAEVFAIGLTLLSAANLTDFDCLYDLKKCTFDGEELVNVLSEWIANSAISEVLRSLLVNLCCQEPHRRMSSSQMLQILQKHENAILTKNSFVIDNASQKLHNEVQSLRTILYRMRSPSSEWSPSSTHHNPNDSSKLCPSHLRENLYSSLTD